MPGLLSVIASSVRPTTTGTITAGMSLAAQVTLLTITILAGAGSIDFSQLETDGTVIRLLVLAVLAFVAVTVIVLVVPKWRQRLWGRIQEPLSQMKAGAGTLKNPVTTFKVFGAMVGVEVLYGAGFALCVLAMGGSVHLGEAIFINIAVSMFAGLMPGGGAGVAEAGMAAGLTAVGVDQNVAISAVLIYRMVSNYLPLTWGYVSLRWLTRNDYL